MHLKKSGSRQKRSFFAFEAIGTKWSVEYESGATDSAKIISAIHHRIDLFDKTYSRFRSDSLVTRIAQTAGTVELPSDAGPLFDFYADLYSKTEGAVNMLVGNTLSDAGYDATYSLQFKKKSVAPDFADTVSVVDGKLTTKQPVLIDVGAAGKGYLVDIICGLLRDFGVRSGLVDAGGDLRVFSDDDVVTSVALEHPSDRSQAIGVATLSNSSLCGSATTLRSWGQYSHVIDPRSAESPSRIVATWAQAETAMVADGISTALFFTNPKILQNTYAFEYAIMYRDNSLEYSSRFPATFFKEGSE